MIGNDIIDLAKAREESDWTRAGFLDKIFTEGEQRLIFDYVVPESMVWILWSLKESAYKIYNRKKMIRAYIPLKLICSELGVKGNCIRGIVSCEGNIFYTKTLISNDCIETIAVEEEEDFQRISIVDNSVIITKIDDLPGFYNEEKQRYQSVSISHHGRFKRIVTI